MQSVPQFLIVAALAAVLPAQTQTGAMIGYAAGDQFGSIVVPFRDVDGDGATDLLIAAPARDNSTISNAGRVDIRSGRSGAVLRTHGGVTTNAYFGSSIAVLSDIDGDGVADYAIGVPGADSGGNDSGALQVFSGATGALLRNHFLSESQGKFGSCVVALPDIDLDGIGDYAASAIHPTNRTPYGRVVFLSGATGGIITIRYGFNSYDNYGLSLAVVGDVNGDGRPDLAIGAPTMDWLSVAQGGVVEVVSMVYFTQVLLLHGNYTREHYGSSIVDVGDLDGDGWREIAIGRPDLANAYGFVDVVRHDGSVLRSHHAGINGDRYGLGLAGLGDQDYDGVPDYAIGAPGAGSGAAWFVSGRTGATRAMTSPGGNGAGWGRTIAWVGDPNGDSLPEFAVAMTGQGAGEIRCFGMPQSPTSTTFGSSCGLTAPDPCLRLQSGGAIGEPITVRHDTAPWTSGLGVLMVGWSRTSHLGTPLPTSLQPYGFPGCYLFVSPLANVVVPQTARIGYVNVGTPRGAAMVGTSLYCQYALLVGNTAAFTNGLGVQFGTPF